MLGVVRMYVYFVFFIPFAVLGFPFVCGFLFSSALSMFGFLSRLFDCVRFPHLTLRDALSASMLIFTLISRFLQVLRAYEKDRFEMLHKVFDDEKYLEELAGLDKLKAEGDAAVEAMEALLDEEDEEEWGADD